MLAKEGAGAMLGARGGARQKEQLRQWLRGGGGATGRLGQRDQALEAQATESLAHARQAGELVTWLGGHPSLALGPLLESHRHDIGDILRESLHHEAETLKAYEELLALARDNNVRLEEYARDMIAAEMAHQDEVDKMLRKPGQTEAFSTP